MVRRVKPSTTSVVIDPKVDVDLTVEKLRSLDDKPLKIGTIVKRERVEHELYGFLPKVHGRVIRVYRLPHKGDRIMVDILNKKGHVQPVYLDTLHRSSSKCVPKQKVV